MGKEDGKKEGVREEVGREGKGEGRMRERERKGDSCNVDKCQTYSIERHYYSILGKKYSTDFYLRIRLTLPSTKPHAQDIFKSYIELPGSWRGLDT